MGLERLQEAADALGEAIVDLSFVLERLDLVPPLLALLVDLVLLGADKGPLVDIGVDFNVGVIAELEIVLPDERKVSMVVEGACYADFNGKAFGGPGIPICCSRQA
jgi:hypothetical protein